MAPDDEITPKVLLEHLQQMELRIGLKVEAVRVELKADIVDLRQKVERMERNLSGQMETIDERLDAIEIERLPRRVGVLEQAMGK